MMKRVLSLLLALAMCLSLMPTALADDDAHFAARGAAGGEPTVPEVQSGSYYDYVTVDETGKRITKSEPCSLIDGDSSTLTESWYAVGRSDRVTINGDVTFTNPNANLILDNGAELTINGTLKIAGVLNIYGNVKDLKYPGDAGNLIVKNTSGYAVEAASSGATICFYGDTVCLSGSTSALNSGVTLKTVQQAAMKCAVGEYGNGKIVKPEEWQSGWTSDAPALYVKQDDNDHAWVYTHIEGDETHHIAICEECGYSEGGIDNGSPLPVDCDYTDVEGFYSDETGHYEKCLCGNIDKANGKAHVYTYTENGQTYNCILPTEDLQKHVLMCATCGYENGTPERHEFDDTYTCTKCGFVRVATDYNGKMFDKVEAALHAGSNGVSITAQTTVGPNGALGWGVDENIYFDPADEGSKQMEVELWTQGRVLYAGVGSVLTVSSGTLTLLNNDQKPGIEIIQDGWDAGNGASAVCLNGGALIFANDLTASGGYNSYGDGNAQYPAVAAYKGNLSFNGKVALEGGLYLTGGAVLETPLKAGDRFYVKADSGKDVSNTKTLSVEGSTVYKNLSELLPDGCAFAYCDAAGNLVDASGSTVEKAVVLNVKDLKSLTKNVIVVGHTHWFKATMESAELQWVCDCGAVCTHNVGEDGKCTICKAQFEAEFNGKYYFKLYDALLTARFTGGTVRVLGYNEYLGPITLDKGNIVLDLNGKTVTGTLSISGTTTFQIMGAGTFKGDIELKPGATLQLKGAGTIDGTIEASGTESDKTKLLLTDGWNGTVTNITVKNAQLEMSGGTVSNVLSFLRYTTDQAKSQLTITGGTIQHAFGNNTRETTTPEVCATLQQLLPDGYTLQKKDGSHLTADERGKYEILEEVTVVQCVHEYENGTCKNCGAVCTHDVGEDGKCKLCGKQVMVAKISYGYVGDTYMGDRYFDDFNRALQESEWTSGVSIILLADTSFTRELKLKYVIDLNGHTLTGPGELKISEHCALTIEDNSEAQTGVLQSDGTGMKRIYVQGGTLTVKSGTIAENIYYRWGTVDITGGTFQKEVTFASNSAPALSGGTFAKLWYVSTSGNTHICRELLKDGYAFADPKDGTIRDGRGTELYNVHVVPHEHGRFRYESGDGICECGYVCHHESGVSGEGKCTVCGMEYVAKIGEQYYTTLYAAFEAAENNDTITLLRSTNNNGSNLSVDGKTLTLELGSFDLGGTGELIATPQTNDSTEAELKAHAGTLKITGSGNLFGGGDDFGILVVRGYSTLDLSSWTGRTVHIIRANPNAKIILPTSSAPTIRYFALIGEATDGLLEWSPRAPQYSPTFERIAGDGSATVKLGDLLKNAPKGCAFHSGSAEEGYEWLNYDTPITDNWESIVNVTLTSCGHADEFDHNAVCDYCGAELLAKHESLDKDGDANTTYILLSEGVAKIAEYVKDSDGASQRLTLMRGEGSVTLTNESVPLTLTMGAYAKCDLALTFDNIKATVTDGKYGTLKANANSTLNITGGEFNVVELNGGDGSFTGGTFKTELIERTDKALIEYLPIGYAFAPKEDNTTICRGDCSKLTNVTVITHEDALNENGECACGRVFGAAMTVEGKTTWYKTLVDAAEAANQMDGAKTIKLYRNYTGAVNPKIEKGAVTLDLNGKTIKPSPIWVNGATLTVEGKGVMAGVGVGEKALGKLIINSHEVTVSEFVAVFNGSTAEISGGSYQVLSVGPKGATAVLSGGSFGKIESVSSESADPKDFLAPDYAYRYKAEDNNGTWVTRELLDSGVTLYKVTVEPVPFTLRIVNSEEEHTTVFGDVNGTSGAIDLALTPGASEDNAFKESITLQLYVGGERVDEKEISANTNPAHFNAAVMFANVSAGTYEACHVDVTYRGYTTSTETFAVTVLPSKAALSAGLLGRSNPDANWQEITGSCEYGAALKVSATVYGTGERLENTRRLAVFGANAQPQSDYFVVLDEAGREISARVARDPRSATVGSDGRLYYSAELDLMQTLSIGEHTLTVQYVSASGLNTGDASTTLTVTVNKKQLTPTVELDIPEGGYVYDGTAKEPGVTVKDGDTIIPATEYDVTYHYNVNASKAAMVAVTSKLDGNYDFGSSVATTFTIAQKPLEGLITFSNETLTYTGDAQAPSFTASYMEKPLVEGADYTVAYYRGETKLSGMPSDAGDYTVVITGTKNFSGAVRKDYTIHKATITGVEVTSTSRKIYNGEPQKWGFGVQATTVSQTSWSITFSDKAEGPYVLLEKFTPFTNAGTYKVYYKISAPNHEDASGETEVVIDPLNISLLAQTTVTLGGDSLTYTGKEQTQTVKKVEMTANGKTMEVTTFDVTGNTGTNAGSYELTVTGTGNFTGSVTQKWSIGKKFITMMGFDWIGKDPTYTGELQKPPFTFSDSDIKAQLVEGKDYELVYPEGKGIDAGYVTVRLKGLESGNYYLPEYSHGFKILSATLTNIKVEADALIYNGEAQTPTVRASATAVNDQPVTFTYSAEQNGAYSENVPSFTDEGTYTVYYKVTAPNHHEASGSFEVVIAKKSLTGAKITLGDSLTYNGAAQTQTIIKVETSDGMTVTTFDVTDNTGTNAGEYELTVTGKGGFEGSATMKWSIARKPLTDPTIEIAGGNVYTGSALTPQVTVKDGETVIPTSEYTVRYDDNTNAGTAKVTLVDKTGGNYAVSGRKTFEIAKAAQTLTADDITATYGDTGVSAALSSSAFGAVRYAAATEADAQIVAVDAESGALTFLKSGTARVTTTAAGDGNHEPGSVTIYVTVAKRAISITVKDAEMRSGRPMPAFEAVYGNFAAGESAETVFETPAVLTTEASGSKLGSFPITVQTLPTFKPGMEEKYAFGTPVNGTLLVKLTPDEDSKPGYPIEIDDTDDGTVEIEPRSAAAGDTVNITVKPKPGFELDDLTVVDSKGDELPLRPNGDGSYRFTMPSGKVTVRVRFTEQTDGWFEDVAKDAYYYEAVKWAVKNGVTTGVSKTRFDPNGDCTRAQIVTFLWRAAGSPEPETRENPFTDVSASAYYYKAVLWAIENGITFGTSRTTFSPDEPCTRAQCVAFLHRWLGEPKAEANATFHDVPEQAYYAGAVAWAQEANVTGGIGANRFGSDNKCTRAQIVTFLWRAMQK